MKRPIGALALAILTFLQGLYQVYVVLSISGSRASPSSATRDVPQSPVGPGGSSPGSWRSSTSGCRTALDGSRLGNGGLLITGFNLLW